MASDRRYERFLSLTVALAMMGRTVVERTMPIWSLGIVRSMVRCAMRTMDCAFRRVPFLAYARRCAGWGHQSCVKSVSVVNGWVFTGSWDHTVKKFDLRTGECLATLADHIQDVIGICAAPPPHKLVFSCGDHCRMWDAKSGTHFAKFGIGTYYAAVANDTHVFVAKANGNIERYRYAHPDGRLAVEMGEFIVNPEVCAAHTQRGRDRAPPPSCVAAAGG